MYGIFNDAGLLISIPYVTKEKAERALARMQAHQDVPQVEITTGLPDGSLLTESYPLKKIPRNP